MEADIDLWRLAAGLGLFLFGLYQLEHALQRLAGRPFKRFLSEQTSSPIKGVATGALATAALQSSSVVGLIVLAFVGAGIISLASAIGIVFGANLGTTATGWLVATLGFKLDIEALAMPLVAIGALGVVWSRDGTRRSYFSQLIAGFGLLLLGLDFMKAGTESATALFNPEALAAYPLIVWLGVGILLTAVIQSSSATIMITLSALYAGVIDLEPAAAIAIGADLGTTITIILGALAGSPSKKRVAAALVLFNLVADLIAFLFLRPLLYLITDVLGISDPLFALVAFHSLFNLVGILIFLPLIKPLSRRLAAMFVSEDAALTRYLRQSDLAVPDVAIKNVRRETLRLIDQASAFNQLSFGLNPSHSFYDGPDDRRDVAVFDAGANRDRSYAALKHLEGAITEYALDVERQPLQADESAELSQAFAAIRNAVHSAKCVRDTAHDLESFRDSVNDAFHAYLARFRVAAQDFYSGLDDLRDISNDAARFEYLVQLRHRSDALHADMHAAIHRDVRADGLGETEISTVLNVNRELYTANQSIVIAIADVLLDPQAAENLRAVPATH